MLSLLISLLLIYYDMSVQKIRGSSVLYYGYDYAYIASSLVAIKTALGDIRQQMENQNDFK
jgi:hypothetical protein